MLGILPGRSETMYEQIQSQMIQMSKQFANAALQANTLALQNAERLISMPFKTLEDRINANVPSFGQASAARDSDALKQTLQKRRQVAQGPPRPLRLGRPASVLRGSATAAA